MGRLCYLKDLVCGVVNIQADQDPDLLNLFQGIVQAIEPASTKETDKHIEVLRGLKRLLEAVEQC